MDINLKEVLKKVKAMHKQRIIESSIAFFIITFFVFSPVNSLAGGKGYMIIKDNESLLDPNKAMSITTQSKLWLTDENARIENTQEKNSVLLINMLKGKIYQLNIQDKTYRILEFPKGSEDAYEKWDIKSQKMNQKKKCAEWACYGIKINMQSKEVSFDIECWLTKDVEIPIALRKKIVKYFKFLGTYQITLTEELAKYEGYPVQTVLSIKAHDKEIKMVSNVIEFKKMDIDPKIFEIPDDFKLDDVWAGKKLKEEKVEDPNKSY
jgi:hypothetical protein